MTPSGVKMSKVSIVLNLDFEMEIEKNAVFAFSNKRQKMILEIKSSQRLRQL